MKKLFVILLAVCIASTFINAEAQESQDGHIPGLAECMDRVFLKNCPDPAVQERMHETLNEAVDDNFYNSYLPGLKFLGRTDGESDEKLYEQYCYSEAVNFEEGYKIYLLHINKYMKQYAAAGVFDKLIDENTYYWNVPYLNFYQERIKKFLPDGTIAYNRWKGRRDTTLTGNAYPEMLSFIKDYDKIDELLKDAGETRVYDIKIILINNNGMMFINGEKEDYLMDPSKSTEPYDPDMYWMGYVEGQVLYTAEEMMELMSIIPTKDRPNYSGTHENITKPMIEEQVLSTKPTFSAEAEALQSEGLLQGNENGLDLLKPLTRIEAATMLLRAIGESETVPDTSTQVFSDVPPSHWGFGAAEKAQSLGIVNGMGDGTFAPDEIVTDTQFSAMVLRAADTGEFDWEQSVNMLIERGIITAEDAETMDLFTRGDMAKIIYEAREKGLL